MKQTINFYNFSDEFRKAGRADQFTYKGQRAIFEYLEGYEESTGEEVELDVVAICCEYSEYENLEEFHGEYNKEDYPNLESLRDFTEVIPVCDDSFIIGIF